MSMSTPFIDPIAHRAMLANDKSRPARRESVAAILTRFKSPLIQDWLVRTKRTPELDHLLLRDEERTAHLPKLVDDLVVRPSRPQVPDKETAMPSHLSSPSPMASCDGSNGIPPPC
jgi:hypothetical protein